MRLGTKYICCPSPRGQNIVEVMVLTEEWRITGDNWYM
jgi:hypothetical protein